MKTLLLNSSYEVLSFVSFRQLIRLIVKGKAEVLSVWEKETIHWGSSKMRYPSIIRMNYYVRRSARKAKFNRRSIFKRDFLQCQYCGVYQPASKLTVDHVVPRSQGGQSTWTNCTTACFDCNGRKADKTPDQAKMALLSQPTMPKTTLTTEYILTRPKHPDWKPYFSEVEYMYPKMHIDDLPIE